MGLQEQYAFRDELVKALTRDIIGPESDDEILDDAPITRYIAGILFPQGRTRSAHRNINHIESTRAISSSLHLRLEGESHLRHNLTMSNR